MSYRVGQTERPYTARTTDEPYRESVTAYADAEGPAVRTESPQEPQRTGTFTASSRSARTDEDSRATMTLTFIDQEGQPSITFDPPPPAPVWVSTASWKARDTAGAKWAGGGDGQDWTGNPPLKGTWEFRVEPTNYTRLQGSGAIVVDEAKKAWAHRVVRDLARYHRQPTNVTGEPSRVRLDHGSAASMYFVIIEFTATPVEHMADGRILSADLSMQLSEVPYDEIF